MLEGCNGELIESEMLYLIIIHLSDDDFYMYLSLRNHLYFTLPNVLFQNVKHTRKYYLENMICR